ncbi:MAG: NAD(P)H-hydrate epimerase, partial [Flavobacteriaceae bacterium]|nr:NAD(P)H-hydrate epimerase [Flavobacteriaceae bacterium]
MKIFSSKQLYKADQVTTEKENISSVDLMERAGIQIFNWLHQRMQGAQVPIHIFCGIGNNGGDGLVLGRHLVEHGYNVKIYVANFTDKRSKCFLINYDRFKNTTKDWPILMKGTADFPQIDRQDVVIDALFGIGINRPPEGWVKELIQYLNQSKAFTLSIDIPSGLYAESTVKDPDAVVKANHTLTFQAPKLAFFMPENAEFITYFEVLNIGLDAEFLQNEKALAQLIAKPEAQQFYKQRKKFDHKGTFGHALIVAGSYGKMGAAVLAAKASFRVGAGKVSCFVPNCGYEIMQTAIPEAMVITDEKDDLISNIHYDIEPTTIAFGMGVGTQPETVSAFKEFLEKSPSSLLIDADGLNILSENAELLSLLPKHSILTPHPGELERLIGSWSDDFDKLKKAQQFVEKYDIVLILKGAHTMV